MSKRSLASSEQHVFITGMARSGTTSLLNFINSTDLFASMSYADMPFVMAPSIWKSCAKIIPPTSMSQERLHGDGMLVTTDSPESFEEVFWGTFKEEEALERFVEHVAMTVSNRNKKRYLSKNNQNVRRIQSILDVLPNCRILIPVRKPLDQSGSLLRQHLLFKKAASADSFIGSYLNWVGHFEFGPCYKKLAEHAQRYPEPNSINHWLEQWLEVYGSLKEKFSTNPRVLFVPLEELYENALFRRKVLRFIDCDERLQERLLPSRLPIAQQFDSECDRSLVQAAENLFKHFRIEC